MNVCERDKRPETESWGLSLSLSHPPLTLSVAKLSLDRFSSRACVRACLNSIADVVSDDYEARWLYVGEGAFGQTNAET